MEFLNGWVNRTLGVSHVWTFILHASGMHPQLQVELHTQLQTQNPLDGWNAKHWIMTSVVFFLLFACMHCMGVEPEPRFFLYAFNVDLKKERPIPASSMLLGMIECYNLGRDMICNHWNQYLLLWIQNINCKDISKAGWRNVCNYFYVCITILRTTHFWWWLPWSDQ